MRVRATFTSPAAEEVAQPRVGADARQSAVPYLFGGLAAMMGLITFALLVLACSYWKLSDHLDAAEGEAEQGGGRVAEEEEWGRKVVVIMAGQAVPTFLATPSTSRSSSFGDGEKAVVVGGVAGGLIAGDQTIGNVSS